MYTGAYRPRRMNKPRRRRFPIKALLLIVLIVAALCYPFIEASFEPSVDRHTLRIANLDPNLKNLKIAYITDIHQCLWFPQNRVEELVRQINGLSADIIILGGDYATDTHSAIKFFENLPPITARIGVYAIMGSSDRDGSDALFSKLIGVINGKGITPLVNNLVTVKRGKTPIIIAGADDLINGDADVSSVSSKVKEDDFVIFAAHNPDMLEDMLKARGSDGDNHWFDIALFGSTHGGQIHFFGRTPFPAFRPAEGRRYLRGWLEENRAAILVSRGVGTSFVPIRFFSTPQIHLITLKSR